MIHKDTSHLVLLSRSMVLAIRRIDRNLSQFDDFQSFYNCPILRRFNTQISSALRDISKEYTHSSYLQNIHR